MANSAFGILRWPSGRCKLLTRWAFEYFDQTRSSFWTRRPKSRLARARHALGPFYGWPSVQFSSAISVQFTPVANNRGGSYLVEHRRRSGAGSILCSFKLRFTVFGASLWPRLAIAPWIRS